VRTERMAAGLAGLLGVVVAGWVGSGPGAVGWPSVISAGASLGAVAGLLWWLAEEPPVGGWWFAWVWGGAGALVLAVGSALDFALWFTDSRWWTVACHVLALALVAQAGGRGGWVGGLRAALVAHLGATVGILLTFRLNWGTPEQAAVFQAAGVLDAYEATGGADFGGWVTNAFLGSVLPRTIGAMVAGAGLGSGFGWWWKRISRG